MDEPLAGVPRHVCKKDRANLFGKLTAYNNIKSNLMPEMGIHTLNTGNYDAKP